MAGVLAIACTQPLFAQAPCDVKGIATNPAAATNSEYPARTNTFNWYYGQQYSGRWWSLNSAARPNETAIWMPWEQSDNSAMTHILGKTDLPGDGWELLKRNLGFDDSGMAVANFTNPYVVLYNKRSGMLRVFVANAERKQDYQFAEIKLVFGGSASKKAGTLNRLEGIGTALENTSPGKDTNEFSSVTRFLNDGLKWFMADFPMEYDPCVCQFDSKLRVEVNLVSKINIQLTGVTQGTLVAADVAAKTTSTSTDFDKTVAMFKKTGTIIKSGQQTYKTLSGYTTGINKLLTAQGTKSSTSDANDKKAAFAQLTAALGDSGFLKAGLSAVPYLGTAVSLLDSFFGGGKEASGPQQVSIQPMSIEMTTQMTGTMEASSLYQEITFNNPGTRTITTPEEYPYYNEAMGVLSVLRKPVVERTSSFYIDYDGQRRTVWQYRVPEPIQYVINPASGLEVQEFQVALLQGGNYPDVIPAGWHYEGMTANDSHMLRSDYRDASQLSRVLSLDVTSNRGQALDENSFRPMGNQLFLKFMLNLRVRGGSATTQNVLVVLRYPVTIREVAKFTPPATAPAPGVLPQASAATVQAFCNGSAYASAMNLRPAALAAAPPAAPILAGSHVYPNPATDQATLSFSRLAAGHVTAYLTDVMGRKVLTILQHEPVVAGEQQKTFATSTLAPGLYYCVVETSEGRRRTTPLSIVR